MSGSDVAGDGGAAEAAPLSSTTVTLTEEMREREARVLRFRIKWTKALLQHYSQAVEELEPHHDAEAYGEHVDDLLAAEPGVTPDTTHGP